MPLTHLIVMALFLLALGFLAGQAALTGRLAMAGVYIGAAVVFLLLYGKEHK